MDLFSWEVNIEIFNFWSASLIFNTDSSKLKTKKSRTYNKRKKGWRCGIHETDDENVRMDFGKCSHPLICNRDDDRCITKEQAEKNFIKNGRKVVGG